MKSFITSESESQHTSQLKFGETGHRSLKFGPYITSIASKPKAHNVFYIASVLLSESICTF